MPTKREAVLDLERRKAQALGQGGAERVARHRSSGRLTARERLDELLDPGSLREIGLLAHSDRTEVGEAAAADAVITGIGTIDGRRVAVLAVDSTVLGGSTGRISIRKQAHVHYLAESKGIPLVVLGDASGGRLPDLLDATFAEQGGTFAGDDTFGFRHRRSRIPKVTAVLGTSYGDPSFYAAASDLVVITPASSVGAAGPAVLLGATGVVLSNEELAGYDVAGKGSGLIHVQVPDERDALSSIRRFLSYLPANSTQAPPVSTDWNGPATAPEALYDIVPDDFNRAYDSRKVIAAVVDDGSFFEIRRDWGRTIVAGLARMEGQPIALAASQPMHNAGAIDNDGIQKLIELVDLADDFGLPVVCLQDLPGVMIGREVERQGIARRIVQVMRRLNECTVPRVTVVIRKGYGFGWTIMGGYPSGADYIVAWPNAEVGFMAPGTAAPVMYKRELEAAAAEHGPEAAKKLARRLAAEVSGEFAPWGTAGRAAIHDVIRPEDTRRAVLDGLFIGRSEICP
jgi:methylmalonyl-CoA decarboxylase subunit alpha